MNWQHAWTKVVKPSLIVFVASWLILNVIEKWSPYGMTLNVTGSIPRGIYLTEAPGVRPLTIGTIACFAYHSPEWAKGRRYLPEGMHICKPIVGAQGSMVHVHDKTITVSRPDSDDFVVRTLEYDSKGRPLPQNALRSSELGEGELILMSNYSKASLDSRYLGVIQTRDIRRTLRPLITE